MATKKTKSKLTVRAASKASLPKKSGKVAAAQRPPLSPASKIPSKPAAAQSIRRAPAPPKKAIPGTVPPPAPPVSIAPPVVVEHLPPPVAEATIVLKTPTPALRAPLETSAIAQYRVLLLGDESLVGEWARLLEEKHVPVSVKRSATGLSGSTTVVLELTNLDLPRKRENLIALDADLPPSVLLLSSSVTVSATEQASWITSPARLVGIGALPTLSSRPLIEVAPTIHSPAAAVETAGRFFRMLGKEIEIVQDRVGLVFARTLCRLINEAAFALAEEVATPQDLDAAMRLGLNHPHGPIEWTDRLGLAHVSAILAALERESGDPRYRTAPLLRQMALAGEWWKR